MRAANASRSCEPGCRARNASNRRCGPERGTGSPSRSAAMSPSSRTRSTGPRYGDLSGVPTRVDGGLTLGVDACGRYRGQPPRNGAESPRTPGCRSRPSAGARRGRGARSRRAGTCAARRSAPANRGRAPSPARCSWCATRGRAGRRTGPRASSGAGAGACVDAPLAPGQQQRERRPRARRRTWRDPRAPRAPRWRAPPSRTPRPRPRATHDGVRCPATAQPTTAPMPAATTAGTTIAAPVLISPSAARVPMSVHVPTRTIVVTAGVMGRSTRPPLRRQPRRARPFGSATADRV